MGEARKPREDRVIATAQRRDHVQLPLNGTRPWVTDGTRLAQVLNVQDDGTYLLEDARTDDDGHSECFCVEPADLARWRIVRTDG